MPHTHDTTHTTWQLPKWRTETTLREICKIQSWKARPKNEWLFPVYWGNGILGYADDFNVEDDMIVIWRVGAYCGCVYFENNKFWLSDNALGLVNNEKSDIKFLYYFLTNQNLNKKSIWGAQPLLTQGILNGIEIIIPSDPKEQRAIAAVLSSFDDKIELLREENKTLEATAQAIFKERFWKYSIDSELPEGWRIGKFKDLVSNVKETLKLWEGLKNRKYVPIDEIPMKRFGLDSYKPIEEAQSSLIGFESWDILFWAMRAYFHRVNFSHFSWVTRATTIVLRPNKPLFFIYSLILLNLDESVDYANQHGQWTTMPYAVWNNSLENMPSIIPSQDILLKFDCLVKPFLNKIINNVDQIQSLSKARDTLLPKLMKGEVRVEF